MNKYWLLKNLNNDKYIGINDDCDYIIGDCEIEEKDSNVYRMSKSILIFPSKELAEKFSEKVYFCKIFIEEKLIGNVDYKNQIDVDCFNMMFDEIEKHSALAIFRYIHCRF